MYGCIGSMMIPKDHLLIKRWFMSCFELDLQIKPCSWVVQVNKWDDPHRVLFLLNPNKTVVLVQMSCFLPQVKGRRHSLRQSGNPASRRKVDRLQWKSRAPPSSANEIPSLFLFCTRTENTSHNRTLAYSILKSASSYWPADSQVSWYSSKQSRSLILIITAQCHS